jgi:outer membrane biosynthesis protein TonB
MGQDASFASTGTAISRYQHKLYLGIGSRWNLKVQQTMAKIDANRVVISFFVNPDGSISQIHIIEGDPNSILGQISGDAINQSSSLIGPFPDALLVRHPKGFPWRLAFRIK